MSNKEYRLFNILFIALLICLFLVSFIIDDSNGFLSCQVLETTGRECKSCGLTRDFIAFAHLDFRSPINGQSIIVFIWFMIQLGARVFVACTTSWKGIKMMRYDLIISLSTALLVFLPFWI